MRTLSAISAAFIISGVLLLIFLTGFGFGWNAGWQQAFREIKELGYHK